MSDKPFIAGIVLLLVLAAAVTLVFVTYAPGSTSPETGENNRPRTDRMYTHPLFSDTVSFYVIAHRGAKSDYPENTMPAFKAALRRGANMIELDVRLSADGIPVVIHDATVNRTTDAKGKVSAYTVRELQQMDAGGWFKRRYAGVQIPTLREVLRWANDRIALNIELKPLEGKAERHGGLEEKSVNLVRTFGMEDQVLFSSFDYEAIRHVETMNPELATGMLYNRKYAKGLLPSELVARYEVDAFHCSKDQLNKRWIQNLRYNDIPFLVYTVNRKTTMRRILQQGATGIFTNKPEVLYEVVDKMGNSGD